MRIETLPSGELVEVRKLIRGHGKDKRRRALLIPGIQLLLWDYPDEVIVEYGKEGNGLTIRPYNREALK